MHLIIGLGNPGKKYENTRHNVGFLAVEHFLEGRDQVSCQHKFDGELCEMSFIAEKLLEGNPLLQRVTLSVKALFLKPLGYMNNSGKAVAEAVRFYKIDVATELLVIHDEVDLKFGYVKPAFDSGPAGHNGVKSTIEHLGTQEFHRLRVGVETRGSRHEKPTDDFVLEKFSKNELEQLDGELLPKIDAYIANFLVTGKLQVL